MKKVMNDDFIRSSYSHTMVSAVIVNGKKEKFNANEKLIYGYLLGWSKTVKETSSTIYPGRIDIALHCGIERLATVDECLKRLKSKGLISWVKGEGKGVANVYTVYDIATVECVYPDYAKQLSGTSYNYPAQSTSVAEQGEPVVTANIHYQQQQVEKDLLATKSITRLPDNLKIDIDPYDKLIYMTMRDSFYGYKNAGLEYYEDQTDIAAAAGVSVSKLKKSIKKWQSLGLITVKTIRTAKGNKSNAYIVTSFSDVYDQYSLECPERFKGKSDDDQLNLRHETTPQEEQHAMVLQPAEKHEPDAVRPPPNTPERDRDMELEPCQVYLQKLYAPFFSCLKVGIAKDTVKRVKKQKTNSMFKHQVLKTWNVKDRKKALEIEGVILKEFERSQCLKEWLPDGATETLPIGVEDEVINKINMLVNACNSQL